MLILLKSYRIYVNHGLFRTPTLHTLNQTDKKILIFKKKLKIKLRLLTFKNNKV